jgi:hypothetical protein
MLLAKPIELNHDTQGTPEEVFLNCEMQLREKIIEMHEKDLNVNVDSSGNYSRNYSAYRSYLAHILGLLDEIELDIKVKDISKLSLYEFKSEFESLIGQIDRLRTRLSVRVNNGNILSSTTVIALTPETKEEIHKQLETIRKIINQAKLEEDKKDAICRKIAALQSEIDRDRTTLDANLSKLLDVSVAIREAGENVAPALAKIDKLKEFLWSVWEQAERILPPTAKLKLLSSEKKQPNAPKVELDDEIPF